MKKTLLLMLLIVSTISSIYSQSTSIWTKTNSENVNALEKTHRSSFPNEYQLYHLNITELRNSLLNAPLRGELTGVSNLIIELPNSEGIVEHYRIVETPIMEAGLAAKFPMIKSYAGQCIENPTAIARFSVTQFGLNSMTLSAGKSSSFIDPYTVDAENYIVYNKESLVGITNEFSCLTNDVSKLQTLENSNSTKVLSTDDKKLRTYRLAQSCTAEYGNIFAGTTGTDAQKKANIQAQMALTITRVNGVYEHDLAITLVFIANNDLLIYYGDVALDPWSGEYNIKTGQTIDANVGFGNYDIGHNFNTSGGGNAGCIGCVCSPDTNPSGDHKGTGMTGRPDPTGDAFDIDYVAHEMGHQFGGYHTQSSSGCRSGNGTSEVEPGSASSIMGYAGICAANVQAHSDDYFTYVNIRDISANVQSGVSSSCGQITNIANNPPTANAGADYVIPKSTAFVLTGAGTDPDGDAITYNWEQNDPENPNTTAAPTATRTAGPMFRTLPSSISNKRYFPLLATVLTGATSNTWEVCPSIARNLNFSLLVRDNHAAGGQTASDLMKVTVIGTAGPFVLTVPNTNVSWQAGTNQVVTWNVAGTDANGVNAKYIDIYLSTDNGANFNILLASKVPNDGSETITVPNVVGTQNRIMVRGFENIFYDLSNTTFTITAPVSTFLASFSGVAGQQNKTICNAATTTYNISYQNLNGFADTTTFSVTGNPAGTTVTFSPSVASMNGTVVMSIDMPNTTPSGFYSMVVTATSGTITTTIPFYLELGIGTATLTNPADLATNLNTTLALNWLVASNSSSYDIQVATDSSFTNIIATGNTTGTTFNVSGLLETTDYYWRISPKNASCNGLYSAPFKFTTGQTYCITTASTNIPLAIATTGAPTINSTLSIPNSFVISDINVTMNVTHSWVNDLTATLISPAGTLIQLFARPCTNATLNNIAATFDDSGVTMVCAINPAISGTIKPTNPLFVLNGQNGQGTWTLRIKDNASGDGGSLTSWSLNACSLSPILKTYENVFENFALYPNPNNGSFNIQLQADASNKVEIEVYDISGRIIFAKQYANNTLFNENINLDNVSTGMYLVYIKNGLKTETRKILVN
jgi:subtilisin-like proprotein convertase family protein